MIPLGSKDWNPNSHKKLGSRKSKGLKHDRQNQLRLTSDWGRGPLLLIVIFITNYNIHIIYFMLL